MGLFDRLFGRKKKEEKNKLPEFENPLQAPENPKMVSEAEEHLESVSKVMGSDHTQEMVEALRQEFDVEHETRMAEENEVSHDDPVISEGLIKMGERQDPAPIKMTEEPKLSKKQNLNKKYNPNVIRLANGRFGAKD